MSFDAWETGLHSTGDYLMHWGIRGMKHGRRRYQNEDGTWTEAGLEARRKREGFGERRAAKKAAKAERKQARKAARSEARAALMEKRRKNNLKNLTDEELQARIDRLKMEREYKDLKRSPIVETGMKLVDKYIGYKNDREQRAMDLNKQKIEMMRLRTQEVQAKKATEKAYYDAKASKFDFKKKKQDRKAGLATERKAQLTNAKTNYRGTTILGALGKRANNIQKYKQEERMNPIEAKKAERTRALQKLQNEREAQKTEQERWKAEQEKHKSGKKKG